MFSLSFGEQSEIEKKKKKKKGKGKVGAEVVVMVMKREKKEGPTCRVYAPHFIIDFSYSVPTVSKQSFLLLRAVSVFFLPFFSSSRGEFLCKNCRDFYFFFFYSVSFPHFISFFFCYTKTKTSSSIHIGTFNFSEILSSFSINNLWIFLILEFFHSSKK